MFKPFVYYIYNKICSNQSIKTVSLSKPIYTFWKPVTTGVLVHYHFVISTFQQLIEAYTRDDLIIILSSPLNQNFISWNVGVLHRIWPLKRGSYCLLMIQYNLFSIISHKKEFKMYFVHRHTFCSYLTQY